MSEDTVSWCEAADEVEGLCGCDPSLKMSDVLLDIHESRMVLTSGIPAAVVHEISAGLWISIFVDDARYSAYAPSSG